METSIGMDLELHPLGKAAVDYQVCACRKR